MALCCLIINWNWSDKFVINWYLSIPLRFKYAATLPCEIWMLVNWRQSEICINKSQGSVSPVRSTLVGQTRNVVQPVRRPNNTSQTSTFLRSDVKINTSKHRTYLLLCTQFEYSYVISLFILMLVVCFTLFFLLCSWLLISSLISSALLWHTLYRANIQYFTRVRSLVMTSVLKISKDELRAAVCSMHIRSEMLY